MILFNSIQLRFEINENLSASLSLLGESVYVHAAQLNLDLRHSCFFLITSHTEANNDACCRGKDQMLYLI